MRDGKMRLRFAASVALVQTGESASEVLCRVRGRVEQVQTVLATMR